MYLKPWANFSSGPRFPPTQIGTIIDLSQK